MAQASSFSASVLIRFWIALLPLYLVISEPENNLIAEGSVVLAKGIWDLMQCF